MVKKFYLKFLHSEIQNFEATMDEKQPEAKVVDLDKI